jgi:hypothetical protein
MTIQSLGRLQWGLGNCVGRYLGNEIEYMSHGGMSRTRASNNKFIHIHNNNCFYQKNRNQTQYKGLTI